MDSDPPAAETTNVEVGFIATSSRRHMAGKDYEGCAIGDACTSPWRYLSESGLREFRSLTDSRELLFESSDSPSEHLS